MHPSYKQIKLNLIFERIVSGLFFLSYRLAVADLRADGVSHSILFAISDAFLDDAVAVFAEEHRVTDALGHAWDVRRQMINTGREQDAARFVNASLSHDVKNI